MATNRFWVAIPGEPETKEMTLDELAERHRGGKLPAGTRAMRFEETDWHEVASLPEVQEKANEEPPPASVLEGGPPPSSSAQGVDLFDQEPGIAPTIAGAMPTHKSVTGVEPTALVAATALPPREDKGRRGVILSIVGAVAFVVIGAIVVFAWMRYGYSRGAVLEHVPGDCARLEYVDFAGIDDSGAVRSISAKRDKALTDWAEDLDDADGIRRSTEDDAYGRASTLRVLKKLGLRPYGDVKEVAFCEMRDGDEIEKLVVIGGTFRGRDLLTTLREALLHRDRKAREEKLKLDEVDGRPYLRLDDNRYATMATAQIVLIGRKKTIARFIPSKPVARSYGIRDGEVIVRFWEAPSDKQGPMDERYMIKGGQLTYTRKWTPGEGGDGVASGKERMKSVANRLRKNSALDILAEAYDAADVKAEGSEATSVIVWSMKDLTAAAKVLVDADRKDMRDIVEALRNAPGSEFLHHVVLPGTDYFTLRLSPWE